MSNRSEIESHTESSLKDINSKTGRNMPQAVATGTILVLIIVACLLIRIDLFVLLIVFFMMLGLWELRVDFATVGLHIPVTVLWFCSIVTLLATYYAANNMLATGICIMGSLLVVVLSSSVKLMTGNRLAAAVAGKQLGGDDSTRLKSSSEPSGTRHQYGVLGNVMVSIFTLLYITLLASCLILPLTFGGHPVAHAIVLIFIPALSDTGGLFAGAWLGRHKLSPRISPKKSVEGLMGSMLFAMAGAFVVFACTYGSMWTSRWWVPIVIGIMVGVVGTFGDLCASMLKRDIGIKDMGHLLKGHGGVLDRVDSILICAPFLAAMLWFLGI